MPRSMPRSMPRRLRPPLVLLVALLLAFFGAAKWATRWRPVALSHLHYGTGDAIRVSATGSLVFVDDENFDLASGKMISLEGRSAGAGAWTWTWTPDGGPNHGPQVSLREGAGAARFYDLPDAPNESGLREPPPWVRLRPAEDRVEILMGNRYYRFAARAAKLEHSVELGGIPRDSLEAYFSAALSREGDTVIMAGDRALFWLSTRTGRVLKRVPVQGAPSDSLLQITPLGTYVFYSIASPGIERARVTDAHTGRADWIMAWVYGDASPVVSPDEREVAIPMPKRKRWEVRALRDGTLLRTLPLVPQALGATYSPDGATFYSVAEGVLYRQRAR